VAAVRYDWADPTVLGWTVEESSWGGTGTGSVRIAPVEGGGRRVHAEWTNAAPAAHAVSRNKGRTFETLSGGQQARFQILLLELSGATLLLLDEPTDNLDVQSAEALDEELRAFDGTVLAVTHDRRSARDFDRYLVFGEDGQVYETTEPVWDEGRVKRIR
jgi:ATPase subunit of ABC transporter with duplicated ATPase domains